MLTLLFRPKSNNPEIFQYVMRKITSFWAKRTSFKMVWASLRWKVGRFNRWCSYTPQQKKSFTQLMEYHPSKYLSISSWWFSVHDCRVGVNITRCYECPISLELSPCLPHLNQQLTFLLLQSFYLEAALAVPIWPTWLPPIRNGADWWAFSCFPSRLWRVCNSGLMWVGLWPELHTTLSQAVISAKQLLYPIIEL